MTEKQKETLVREIIKNNNLKAFIANFGEVRIEKEECGNGFYVFYPAESESWIQYCYDINYLNGWLYGVVQGAVRGEFANPKLGM